MKKNIDVNKTNVCKDVNALEKVFEDNNVMPELPKDNDLHIPKHDFSTTTLRHNSYCLYVNDTIKNAKGISVY